ncbi:MAG: hypothetical protein JWO13_520 [Acidobacteriales bacterium]|nr:hypothetical protein [Terriglobales bacterium]
MGTSFVKFKGFGYWSRDAALDKWLVTLLEDMRSLQTLEPWQEALMNHWRAQVGIDAGCMSLGLDEFLTDSNKELFVLSLSKQAISRTESLVRRTGELFIDLLEGKLRTNDASPIDYLDPPRAKSS